MPGRRHPILCFLVSVKVTAILLGCGGGTRTGNTTRESCFERYWEDRDGDGWGVCIPEEQMNRGYANVPQVDDSNQEEYDFYEEETDDTYQDEYDDTYEPFVPFYDGRELVECPWDIWGDEPCG